MKTTYTLISGASSGIGKELAEIAAREGRNVILVARDEPALNTVAKDLAKRYAIDAMVLARDLSEQQSPQQIFDALARKKIVVDTLINNAGSGDYGEFVRSNRATQLGMINLNVRTLTELTHLFLPDMVRCKTGYIMNLGSVASFLPGPYMSVYFASKAYVLSFSEALSAELRDSGVSVTCLCPGSTKTSFGESAHVSETHSTRTSHVTPRQVAEFGWKAMKDGKPVAVYGFGNRLSITLTKFLPRSLVVRIVERIQK